MLRRFIYEKGNFKYERTKKYEVIKKLVETNENKKRAAVELDLTIRQINRLIAGYKAYGKKFFMHGNRNVENELFELEEIPIREETSKNFDEAKEIFQICYIHGNQNHLMIS